MELKIKKVFEKLFNILFGIVLIWIIYNMYFQKIKTSYNKFTLYMVTVLFILTILVLYRKLKDFEIKKYMFVVIFAIIIILQIISTILFKINPFWDLKDVYKEATNFSCLINDKDYFFKYPNNIPIALFLKGIFYLCSLIKFKKYIDIGMFVNLLFIDFSIFIMILTVKEIFGKNKAFLSLILISIMPVIYQSVPIFYTDTLSMPFPILILYLFLKLKKTQDNKKKLMYSIFLGFVTVLGMNFKITVLIIYIAIFIYEIFVDKNKKIEIFGTGISLVALICFVLLEVFIFNQLLSQEDKERLINEQFPATHFIMMSLNTKGGYNQKDFDYTSTFSTKQEKIEANIVEIKKEWGKYKTIQEKNAFLSKKAMGIWNDGTYDVIKMLKIGISNHHIVQTYLTDYQKIYVFITQSQRVFLMLLMFIAIFYKKDEDDLIKSANLITRISVFGLILFFLLWEVRAKYIINYIPIFVIIELIGIHVLDGKMKKLEEKFEKITKK